MLILGPFTIPAPGGSGQLDFSAYPNTREARLANYSGSALQVSIGPDAHWLDALTADVFHLPSLFVKFVAVGVGGSAATGSLLVTLADQLGERIPGIYPLHLR